MDIPDHYFDDFEEDLNDSACVQMIYDFSLIQVRGLVEYNDEDDVIQEVFFRLAKWPMEKKYRSKRHYLSLLKITIRQAVAAYWKRRHSQRNDVRKRKFISELQADQTRKYELEGRSDNVLNRLHLKEVVRLLLIKVDTLNANQRTMFQMRFLEEHSHNEISKALKISVRSSYRLESQVRQLLQDHLCSS